MEILGYILGVVLVLFIIYVIALKGRGGNRAKKEFNGVRFAHRGLHQKPTVPENSLAAFDAAKQHGFGIELDVHLTADGEVVVIHDSNLVRTTGVDAIVESMTLSQLDGICLEESTEKIPTLREVLEQIDGAIPLLIELKIYKRNVDALCSRVVDVLKDYQGAYCIESFDPRAVLWFKQHNPDVIRGQLTQNFIRNGENLNPVLRWLLTAQVMNLLTRPDFLAVSFEDRRMMPITLSKIVWKTPIFVWTITSNTDTTQAEREDASIIFEQFIPTDRT